MTQTWNDWTLTTIGWVPPIGWRPSDKNAAAAYEVLDHIDAHPESWTQDAYWCGTSGCFAGWRAVLSGEVPRDASPEYPVVGLVTGELIPDVAARLLGFPNDEALTEFTTERLNWSDHLFDGANTREDLGRIVEAVFGPRPEPAER